jgi:hypothetical protein
VNRNAVSVLEPSASDVFDGLPDDRVTGELVTALGEARRWNARITGLVAVAEKRDLARKQGYPSTTEWLMALSGEPASVCRSKIAVAEALADMPETRTAFTAGDLSESRVKVLAQAQALCPEQFARDEAQLVAQVASASSQEVPKVLAQWKQDTDPVSAEAEAESRYRMRALHLSKDWSGMLRLSGLLDPGSGLILRSAIRALADPANLDPQDTRTPAQCQADALVEVCRQHLQGSNGKRRPPQVLVTIPWNMLQEGRGIVDTEAGPIGANTARRLCCDATVSRVLLDPESVPIELGRATRVVPVSLRRLLELRDQGCTWPGCGRPASWCDAHHLTHWANGGNTDPANLRLLCSHHHTLAHEGEWHPRRE